MWNRGDFCIHKQVFSLPHGTKCLHFRAQLSFLENDSGYPNDKLMFIHWPKFDLWRDHIAIIEIAIEQQYDLQKTAR